MAGRVVDGLAGAVAFVFEDAIGEFADGGGLIVVFIIICPLCIVGQSVSDGGQAGRAG